ncbi:diheme cytochrome c [Faunimonas sp. B44]|uniref:diheme cytochrome c n=1 Tax=Faunimonas sp. B44 TaxID=3461493 RepID=UPI004043E8D4
MKKPIIALVAIAGLTAGAGRLFADEYERLPPVGHAATAKECGECHMVYQPGLLPAASWAAIMDGLPDHFGEDASLPPALAAEIRAYLVGAAGAGGRRRADGTILRITEQPWWIREHDEVRASEWKRAEVISKANCVACHKDAERGLYDDDY